MNRPVAGLRGLSVAAALVLVLSAGLCAAQEITVAAAADLQFAMQEVGTRFQQESGKTVKLIYGSSGNFAQQLQNGAPFDMFFSANLDYPRQLEAAGLTAPGTFYQYAIGKIVVWVPNDSKLDLSSGLKALLNPSIKKIAIANPQHAPYGKAAVAAMQAAGKTEKAYVDECRGGTASATLAPTPTTTAPAQPAPSVAKPAPSLASAPAKTPGTPSGAGQFTTEAQAKSQCPADTVVWVNLNSKIYHFSGTKDYGNTKEGAYMCERNTTTAGFRAAKNEKHP